MRVEVVFALPERQSLMVLDVEPGTTALQAVLQSGVLTQYPDLEPSTLRLGIYSHAIAPDTPLRDHDRVEIYRPLLADPKLARRQRAAERKLR